MANTLLSPSVIAREALMTLYAKTTMLPLVHRDFSGDFAKVGDTVTIRKPAVFTANEFSSAISVQDATESSTSVVLNKHLDVSFAVTAKDMTLKISDFRKQLLDPAMEAIAQKVDKLLLGLYIDTYAYVGTAGTAPSTVADFTGCGRVLNLANVPLSERTMAIDPYAADKFSQIAAFYEAYAVGDNGTALRDASLGRKLGFDTVLANNIVAHSNGTIAHTGTFAVNGAVTAGATTMNVDGSTTLTGTWKAGSIFTVNSIPYVVTADCTAAANAITGVTFFPASAGFADNDVITRIAGHTPNLAFHRTAFAFVTRALELPMGVAPNQADIVDYNGLGLRVVSQYDISSKKDTISVDLLCGVKTLDPARAVRLLG